MLNQKGKAISTVNLREQESIFKSDASQVLFLFVFYIVLRKKVILDSEDLKWRRKQELFSFLLWYCPVSAV